MELKELKHKLIIMFSILIIGSYFICNFIINKVIEPKISLLLVTDKSSEQYFYLLKHIIFIKFIWKWIFIIAMSIIFIIGLLISKSKNNEAYKWVFKWLCWGWILIIIGKIAYNVIPIVLNH